MQARWLQNGLLYSCTPSRLKVKRKAGAAGERDIAALPVPQQMPVAPPVKCRKIKDVLGASMVLVSELSSDEKRVGRKTVPHVSPD